MAVCHRDYWVSANAFLLVTFNDDNDDEVDQHQHPLPEEVFVPVLRLLFEPTVIV